MPVMKCVVDNKPGYKWGKEGKCYIYDPENKKSQNRAYNEARKQGIAIVMAEMRKERGK